MQRAAISYCNKDNKCSHWRIAWKHCSKRAYPTLPSASKTTASIFNLWLPLTSQAIRNNSSRNFNNSNSIWWAAYLRLPCIARCSATCNKTLSAWFPPPEGIRSLPKTHSFQTCWVPALTHSPRTKTSLCWRPMPRNSSAHSLPSLVLPKYVSRPY